MLTVFARTLTLAGAGVIGFVGTLVNAGSVALLHGLPDPADLPRSAIQYRSPTIGSQSWIKRANTTYQIARFVWDGNPIALAGQSRTLLYAGDFEAASQWMDRAAGNSKNNSHRFEAGRVAYFAGDDQRALAWWMLATPTAAERMHLASALVNSGGPDLPTRVKYAIVVLEDAASLPDLPVLSQAEIFDRIADIAEHADLLNVATTAGSRAVQLNPLQPEFAARLALISLRQGQHARSLELANASERIAPNWRAHYVRGLLAQMECRLDDAVVELQTAVSFPYPSDYRFWWSYIVLADAYWEQGKLEAAANALNKYLAGQPGDSQARLRLVEIQHGRVKGTCGVELP